METNKGFISVSDYAKLRGVSVAAVYKRLGGSLKPYDKEIDGKKFLSVDVLEAEGIKPVEKGIQPGIKPQEAQEHPDQEEAPAQATGTPATVAADIQENQEPNKKPGLWKRIWRAINEV